MSLETKHGLRQGTWFTRATCAHRCRKKMPALAAWHLAAPFTRAQHKKMVLGTLGPMAGRHGEGERNHRRRRRRPGSRRCISPTRQPAGRQRQFLSSRIFSFCLFFLPFVFRGKSPSSHLRRRISQLNLAFERPRVEHVICCIPSH